MSDCKEHDGCILLDNGAHILRSETKANDTFLSGEAPVARGGRPDLVYYSDKDYRSVWYCHHLNEPMVCEFRDNLKHCTNCNFTDQTQGKDENDIADFTWWHTYICNVSKPYGEYKKE